MTSRSLRPLTSLALLVAASLVIAACADSAGREVRSGAAPVDARPATVPGTVAALNAFATDLFRAVGSDDSNIAVATHSVAIGLAMAREGARGETLASIDRVLHSERSPDLALGLATVQQLLASAEGEQRTELRKGEVSVQLAASLWAQSDTRFLDRLSSYFDTGMRVVDFRSNPEGARKTINEWGDRESSGRITQLLPRGSVRELTRFVMPTLGSVRAPWKVRFEPDDTTVGPFARADGTSVETPYLSRGSAGDLSRADGDGWRALAIPYLGDELAMVVVVPTAGPLADLEARLDPALLDEILGSLSPTPVEVSLPPFSFASELDLERPLGDLGLGATFTAGQADFSGITGDEPLFLSRVGHQTYASVDADGSDANAATVVPPQRTDAIRPRFAIDQAFLFLIVHERAGLVLQLGRVVDPTA
jgi:serpin B